MTLDEIVKEVKEKYHIQFFEVAKFNVDQICRALGLDIYRDDIFDLKWTYTKVLRHEYEIRPIIEDCERLLGRRV